MVLLLLVEPEVGVVGFPSGTTVARLALDPHGVGSQDAKQDWPEGQGALVPLGQGVPHLPFASVQETPHLTVAGGVVGGVAEQAAKLPKQYCPEGQAASVPAGQAVPHRPFASVQVTPQRGTTVLVGGVVVGGVVVGGVVVGGVVVGGVVEGDPVNPLCCHCM